MTNFGEQVEESPFASRGFVLSGAFLGVIALVGLLVIALGFMGEDEREGSSSADSVVNPRPTDDPSPGDGESMCGLTEVETGGGLAESPEGTEWELVGKIAAPYVEGHGPEMVGDDGYRSCFSHTPLGAVLAAANWTAMGSDPELSSDLMERILAESPGREVALAEEEASDTSSDDDMSVQIAAFRVISYDGDEASVQIVYTSSYGLHMVFPVDMRWEGGDWKLLLADDGEPVTPPYPVETFAGFIRWQGA